MLNLYKHPFLLLLSGAVFLVIGLVWYFAYPLKVESLLKHVDEVEKIDFIISAEGENHHYSMSFDDRTTVSELIDILDSERYTRELNTYKGSTDRVMMMILFYRDAEGNLNNYSFAINESGIIISNGHQYRMKGEPGIVFNKLYEWMKHKGSYIQ